MKSALITSKFMAALKDYAKVCNIDMAEAMNKTSKDIAFQSVRKTLMMAEKWPVRVQDSPRLMSRYRSKIAGRGIHKSYLKEVGPQQQRKGNYFTDPLSSKRYNTDAIYFALATKRGIRKGNGALTREAQRLYTKRRTAKGYTKWGWAAAIIGMGGGIGDKEGRKFAGHGQSKHGKAIKATDLKHKAIISNTAAGVGHEDRTRAFAAMEQAARSVYRDRLKYIRKKMRERGVERSGRKHAVSSAAMEAMK